MVFKINEKTIKMLKKGFNNVDSTNFVKDVAEEKRVILADDGYEIPITVFKGSQVLKDAPILYYIHGGGFFAGSTNVVGEFESQVDAILLHFNIQNQAIF